MITRFCRWYLDTTNQPVNRVIFSRRERAVIWCSTFGVCPYCQKQCDFKNFHIDHIWPISKGGTNDIKNLVPSHKICNLKKGSKIVWPKGEWTSPPGWWVNFLKIIFWVWIK